MRGAKAGRFRWPMTSTCSGTEHEFRLDTVILSAASEPPTGASAGSVRAVTSLTDEEVLGLAELQMLPAQGRRLSALLQKQQAQELSVPERTELLALMQVYQEGLLRKAQALHEAVRRGLRTSLEP